VPIKPRPTAVPTLPLPTIPSIGTPSPTPGGTPAASSAATPGSSLSPAGVPAGLPSSSPSLGGSATGSGGGGSAGSGGGAVGSAAPAGPGFTVAAGNLAPFGLIDLGVATFDSLDWAVPALALSVPGLLLIAILAQLSASAFWLPIVRRWLGGFGVGRRRRRGQRGDQAENPASA
jgi:hypothetical protein